MAFSNTEHFDCKQEQRAVSTNATGYNEREVVGWGLHWWARRSGYCVPARHRQ